jgi:crotonobetainyl-CoA:carnitine CoA-transferase CaiB-like acyl-CoA transferase
MLNPKLICCSVSAYGHTRPDSAKPGLGLITEAKSGAVALDDCVVSMHGDVVKCYTLSGGKRLPVQTGHDQPDSTAYGVSTTKNGDLVIAAQVHGPCKHLAQPIWGDELAADRRLLCLAGRNAPPFRLSDCDTTPRGPAALMADHSREIAADLGCGPHQVDTMMRDGVLCTEPAVSNIPQDATS